MLRIRRLYFYAVLYASLCMLITGAAVLLRVVVDDATMKSPDLPGRAAATLRVHQWRRLWLPRARTNCPTLGRSTPISGLSSAWRAAEGVHTSTR